MRNRVKFVGPLAVASFCTAFAATAAAQSPTVQVSDARPREEAAAPRAPWAQVRLEFEGNRLFTSEQLRRLATECYGSARKPEQEFDPEMLDYCLRVNAIGFMRRSGYLRAELGETRAERNGAGETVTVPLDEKELYRLGEVEIEGAEFFPPARLREMLPLKAGEVADGVAVGRWLNEHLKKLYADEGFIQYEYDLEPEFRLDTGTGDGVADFKVTVNEGKRFRLRRLGFAGGENIPEDVLRGALRLKEGELFRAQEFKDGVLRLNGLRLFGLDGGRFEDVDSDGDVEFRADEETAELDIVIHLTEQGRERPERRATPKGAAGEQGKPTLIRRPQTREE